MPNDDESKNDDQGSTSSASNQNAEQKTPVYLFPENSVYDLAPIVVPENMRLSPDAFDANVAPQVDGETNGAGEVSQTSDTTVETVSSFSGTESESEHSGNGHIDEVNLDESEPVELKKDEAIPVELERVQTEPVQTEPDELKPDELKPDELKPDELKPLPPSGLPPAGSRLKSKIQVQKVKATQEQSKIAQDSILQNRIENSKAAQSRIEQARAELNSESMLEPNLETNADSTPNSTPTPTSTPSRDPSTAIDTDSRGEEYSRNLFPENSVFEMDPVVVVAEDQKLMPTRRPTYDPMRASQKLSPIKADKFNPGAQRQASEARAEAASQGTNKLDAPPLPVPSSAQPKSNLNWLGVETESVSVAEHGPGESAAVAAGLTIAAPSTAELGAKPVDSTPVIPEEQIKATDSSINQVESTSDSIASETVPIEVVSDSIESGTVPTEAVPDSIESGTVPTEAVPVFIEPAGDASEAVSEREGNWEEATGWEEINSRQDRWSEETGWEDAAGKSSWERGGWADQSGEQLAHANLPAAESLTEETKTQFAPSDDEVPEVVEDEHTVTVSEVDVSSETDADAATFTPKTVGNLFDDNDEFPDEVDSDNELATAAGAAMIEPEVSDWLKPKPVDGSTSAETHGAITGEQEIAEHGFISGEQETAERSFITGEQETAERSYNTGEQEIAERSYITGEQEITERGFITGEQEIPEDGRVTGEHSTGEFYETDQPVPGFTTGKHPIPTSFYQEDASAEAYITGEQSIDPMAFVTGEQPEQKSESEHIESVDPAGTPENTAAADHAGSSQYTATADYAGTAAGTTDQAGTSEQRETPQVLPWGSPSAGEPSHENSVSSLADAILQTGNEKVPIESGILSESILEEVEGTQSNFEPQDPEPFDVNRIGIATADIEQILLEHNSIQLTEGKHDQDSQESNEYQYDEEDVLQDFRSTDSIYELAPFVLPATSERLTEEEQNQPAAKTQPTVQQIVRHAETPERPAVPTYSTDPLVGTVLAHSYEVLDVIGQGGMAIVYRAKQIATGRLVAIKTLRSPNPQDILRFSQEIKTHSQLDHKNIVGYIDSFSARDQMFLVMERVRGISLQEIIRALGKLDEPDNIVDILSQILDALEYAHAGGLIHRDLKTGNIILIKEVDNDMVVKILDFGIAKVQGDVQRLTHVGQALGSPIYMSPEQCSGKQLSTRSDLYSLGVLLYESVTGTPPYSKGTLINVMAAHCNENIKPKPLAEMDVKLPKTKMLDQILQKALQTHPDKRWQSAVEFKTALQFWLKCVQNDLAIEDLPVELLRCPVTELDLTKLLSIAKSPAGSAPVPFQWAKEPVETLEAPQESWDENSEDATWPGEKQQLVPGWGDGAQPQSDNAPGWGGEDDSPKQAHGLQSPLQTAGGQQPWGGSERHRQGQTGDAWRGSAAAAEAAQAASRGASDPTQVASGQQQGQTGDIWSTQEQERRPVRDLLASPTNPNPNFEVQTSVEMNALGTGLPKLSSDEKQEIRSITSTGSLKRTMSDPQIGHTADDTTEPAAAPIDLRRRQQQATPPPPASNWLTIAAIVIVSVVLTLCLSIWYFVSNPGDVQMKMQAIQKLFKQKPEAQSAPETKSAPSSPDLKTAAPQSRATTGSQETQDASSTSPSNYSIDIDLKTKSTPDENSADDVKPRERQPEEGVKPTDPGEFKKAEPEEGVDF